MFKKKSRMITGAVVFVLSTGLLLGCGSKETAGTEEKQPVAEMETEEAGVKAGEENRVKTGDEKYKIVCTTFPQYDWVMQVLGERKDAFDVTLLLDDGIDLHSYQPTAEDIAKIAACDCFIYVGGESDGWVEDALKEATNTDMQVINLLDALGERVKEEEIVEGMEHNHEHEHAHEEFTEADIKDRSLDEFEGEWKSLYPLLANGELDAYCEHKAKEDEDETTTAETYLEKYTNAWNCGVTNINVEADEIAFVFDNGKSVSGQYTYAGYEVKKTESGSLNVRYQFELKEGDAPKYVQFNDHGYEPGEVAHFHIYFGDESFEALAEVETNPYFVKAELTNEEVLEGLMGHEHEHENDEHVWLSLTNAQILCGGIADRLAIIDPENEEVYKANAAAYIDELDALDTQYKEVVEKADAKAVVFGDRFPFRYLMDDYDLEYYAAFAGCSAETEASFETVVFLAEKVDELGLDSVCVIEGSDQKIAETIVQNTKEKNQKILVLDSLQSVTREDMENGVTYLSTMQDNLEVLKEAL